MKPIGDPDFVYRPSVVHLVSDEVCEFDDFITLRCATCGAEWKERLQQ